MAQLSQQDLEIIRELRAADVLQDVDGYRLNQRYGIILVCCSDGDQMPDIWRFQNGIMAKQRQEARIHPITLNGGALLIPGDSPLNKDVQEDLVYLKHIAGAHQLKKIETIVLYSHAPCGAAGLAKLTLIDVITLLKKAGQRVRNSFPSFFQVVCFFHVDNGESKRTYFVSGPKWEQWLAQKQAIGRVV
ncbi:MAG TPA: hypothetical protein VJC15_04365 [Candidatus Paceibacterota bacterium]